MENEPRCDVALAAIQALNESKDPHQQEQAAKWLEDLQNSVYAWKVRLTKDCLREDHKSLSDEMSKLNIKLCRFVDKMNYCSAANSIKQV